MHMINILISHFLIFLINQCNIIGYQSQVEKGKRNNIFVQKCIPWFKYFEITVSLSIRNTLKREKKYKKR